MRTMMILASALSLAACADSGSAPAISALTYSPATATVGMQSTITGSIGFDDEDGDLDVFHLQVIGPDSTVHPMNSTNISGLGDLTSGTLPFQITFVPPSAGTWSFQLWLSDEGNNDSNKLEGTVTVQ